MAFYTEPERTQIRRDRLALEARLERIPAEKEAEKEHIRAHYENPDFRTFPIAVIFLVPQNQTWGAK